jgi:hypothetical protein
VEYFVVVISSLGAIPKETTKDLARLLCYKKKSNKNKKQGSSSYEATQFKLWLKRMVIAAIRGSFVLFYGLDPKKYKASRETNLDNPSNAQNDELENNDNERLHNQLLDEVDGGSNEEEEVEERNHQDEENEIQEEIIDAEEYELQEEEDKESGNSENSEVSSEGSTTDGQLDF